MSRSVVVICMQGAGHIAVLLPVIEALRYRGCKVHAMTHRAFRGAVENAGARFSDLYAGRPLEAVDAGSLPIPARFVSFAGVHGEALTREVEQLEPGLIVYDTYSVVAPVIARGLGIPYINVCPNHAPVPERVVAALRDDPRVAISGDCWAAVARLRTIHGMPDANPFSYVESVSPHLNLYAEPEEFLDPSDRPAFEPVAFFGSLPTQPRPAGRSGLFPDNADRPRVYVSFGTTVWWYYPVAVRNALRTVADSLAGRDVDVVISLGGAAFAKAAGLKPRAPNIRVLDYVDQWQALKQADAFVTHHGINSTHEAIHQRAPMLSYPFFGDQPALAARCQELGLALPLSDTPRGPLESPALLSALSRITQQRGDFTDRLEEARAWERRTIDGRGAVIDQVLALMEA